MTNEEIKIKHITKSHGGKEMVNKQVFKNRNKAKNSRTTSQTAIGPESPGGGWLPHGL